MMTDYPYIFAYRKEVTSFKRLGVRDIYFGNMGKRGSVVLLLFYQDILSSNTPHTNDIYASLQ